MAWLDRVMGRWWQGAHYMLACALAYVVAFVPVMLVLASLDELGIYDPTNWAYWGTALVIAPFVAGSQEFRRMMADLSRTPAQVATEGD